MLLQEVEAELEVRPLDVAVDCLADVVEERRPDRHVRIEPELPRHDTGEVGDFAGMMQDVLPVARSELQAPHEAKHFRVQVVETELECGGLAILADGIVHLGADFLDDFLDARRVNAAVRDQPLDDAACDLAAERIEAGQDDRAGRVVHDQVDAGRELEGADVPALAADDPALEVVARKIDDRDGRLGGVLGRGALDRLRDDAAGPRLGLLARLRFEALHEVRGVAPRV